jgi:hypothetical protein
LDVRVGRWAAPPGAVLDLDGFGPGDGKWILTDMQRDLWDALGTATIDQPQKAFAEPAAAQTTAGATAAGVGVTGPQASGNPALSSANPIDRVYAAAQIITNRHLPYGPGGHGLNWPSAAQASNMDCSSSTSTALWMAGIFNFPGPIVSGDFGPWGVPGVGSQMTVWWSSGHVYIQFYGRPAKRFDTVPGGGPQLRFDTGLDGTPGMTPQHWPGL